MEGIRLQNIAYLPRRFKGSKSLRCWLKLELVRNFAVGSHCESKFWRNKFFPSFNILQGRHLVEGRVHFNKVEGFRIGH